MNHISKDMKIADILSADVGTAEILLKAGMHCLGCPSAQMETLAQASFVHGIETDVLVDEINAYLSGKSA